MKYENGIDLLAHEFLVRTQLKPFKGASYPTLNQLGYMISRLDEYCRDFIHHTVSNSSL